MAQQVQVVRHGRVATITLARNALNTISPDLVEDLRATLLEVSRDESIGAVVLASAAEKFFSAGWELPVVKELSCEDMARFVSSFNQLTIELALLPVPTVAALNGFAVAGGWILALACDWRVMTTGNRRVGINEVDLGVPMPAPAAALARNVGGGAGARDMFVLGRLYAPDEALAAGLVDRLAEPDRVREQARALAELAATKPRASAVAMKRILREPFARAVTPEAVRANERQFLEAWWRPDVRPLLDAAAARLVPR